MSGYYRPYVRSALGPRSVSGGAQRHDSAERLKLNRRNLSGGKRQVLQVLEATRQSEMRIQLAYD